MGIGIGIVLLVLGLILLTGAVDLPDGIANHIADDTLGWILLGAGVLALVLGLYMMTARRRSDTYVERRYDGPARSTRVERDYHDVDPGQP